MDCFLVFCSQGRIHISIDCVSGAQLMSVLIKICRAPWGSGGDLQLFLQRYNFSGIRQFLQGISLEEGSAGHRQMPCRYPVDALYIIGGCLVFLLAS